MPEKSAPSFLSLTALFPIILSVLVIGLRFASFEMYRELVSEDGTLETLQFLFYFFTGCVLLYRLRQLWNTSTHWFIKAAFFVLSGAFVFVSLEEISWGERLLGYQNPDFFAVHNVQQEVSVHNLSFIQPFLHAVYIWAGLFLGLIVPLLNRLPQLKNYRNYLFNWRYSAYFLPLSVIYLILEFIQPISLTGPNIYGFIWRDQEVVETLLAIGLFLWFGRMKVAGLSRFSS